MSDTNDIILEVKGLKQYFPIRAGFFQKVVGHIKAVDGVSFSIHEEEIFGLVGESGCGKTTLGRSILRLYDPTAGEIWFHKKNGERVEISHLSNKAMKPLRQEMRMIFQDPFSSLNPRLPVKELISEPSQTSNWTKRLHSPKDSPVRQATEHVYANCALLFRWICS